MKKTLVTLMLFILPGIAFAETSNNTIKFQGEVAEQTCMVDINGTANTPVVLLPTVSTSNLNQVNSVAGKTNFTINLTGCNIAIQDTQISSVFQGMNVTSGGNLGNIGTARNVAIQLIDPVAPRFVCLVAVWKFRELPWRLAQPQHHRICRHNI